MTAGGTENRPSAPTGKRMPGEEGVWFFILGDLVVFGIFFVTYLAYRAEAPDAYRVAQSQLNTGLGLLNTLLLLTSSWFVAQAVHAMRGARGSEAARWLGGGMTLGVGFVLVKIVEYSQKFAGGTTILTNDFFMFYFMYTGIHLAHVVIGLGVLVFLWRLARTEPAPETIQSFESGGAFWHLVDLLWVVLFALLYLAR